ncbi:heterokaryon incompatibility protein-domain-containing protein [Dactylonectria macrodidyma]|uniref:Heterokaryon incompatibility protein-domain-containing protein n=1 Tax=Dactylonectria macrodidyma TaxID=307937 RepID=A0A9P9D1I3_9HYPO|nr:heterokaryon incompatibility protein-domain-containing protein [Dactylonectria macrodidyma]
MASIGSEIEQDSWKRQFELKEACTLGACDDAALRIDPFEPSETSPLREVSVLKESGRRGCAVCRFLIQVVDEAFPGWTSGDTVGKRIALQNGITLRHHGKAVANFRLKGRVNGHLYPERYVQQGMGQGLIAAVFLFSGLTLNVLPDPSTERFGRARAWLEYCEKNDEHCKPSFTSADFMPRRLLDVLSMASSDKVLLVETKHHAKYACLSYCWGRDLEGVLRTTRSNVREHGNAGIACGALPKTLHDSVRVCRGLAIQYLWIDSLCIIQDEPADWAGEAPRMSEIYGRSHLTIFANQHDSCKSGFLGSQSYGHLTWQGPLQTLLPPEFLYPADAVSLQMGTPLSSRIAPGTAVYGDGAPVSEHRMARSQLDRRGWCLQEELLPNRRLYFDGNEMTWDCCTRSFCECGHMNEDKRPTWGAASKATLTGLKMSLGLATARNVHYTPSRVFDTWKWVLEDYTARFLTNSSDKLVAISGVASMMLKALREDSQATRRHNSHIWPEYCAGLWPDNFLVGMSWVAIRNISHKGPWKPPSRGGKWRAPTWSWASNDAPVEYVSHRVYTQWKYKPTMARSRTKVDEISCEPVLMGDITGQLKTGHACLTGPLVPVELVRLDDRLSNRKQPIFKTQNPLLTEGDTLQDVPFPVALVRGKNLLSYQVSLDTPDAANLLGHADKSAQCWMESACKKGCCGPQRQSKTSLRSMFRKNRPQPPQKLFCLELFSWEDDGGNTNTRTAYVDDDDNDYPGMPPETWFLLLREVMDGVFERVGAGFCEARSDREMNVHWPRLDRRHNAWSTFECPLFQDCQFKSIKII